MYMFRAFCQLAQFRNCVAQIGGCQFACQFRNCVRDFETAQREFLLKLEMAVYIIAAMVANSKHTFTPTKLACEGHADASIDTRFEQYCRVKFSSSTTSDADGDSGEANPTPSTSKATWNENGTRIVHVLKGDPVAHTYSKSFKF